MGFIESMLACGLMHLNEEYGMSEPSFASVPQSKHRSRIGSTIVAALLALMPTLSWAEMKLNLPDPVSPLTREVFDLHMMTTWVGVWIMVIVIALVAYTLWKFRKSTGYEPDQNFHKSTFGVWSWLIVPVIVLGIDITIAERANSTFDKVEDIGDAEVTVKVTGSQWKWTYEYMEHDYSFISNLESKDEAPEGLYLRTVDKPLVLPTHTRVRFLHTASDVLHAWWVPEIAVKKDSIPGYINETWTIIEEEGLYRGQCAENCGVGHAYMPIEVRAISKAEFDTWIGERVAEKEAAAALAASNKDWTMEELMAKGEGLYNTYCAACHQVNGAGLPPAFPGLIDSAIVKGDPAAHIDIVLNGKAGTAMSAWGGQLDDLQLAAIITYERNAWGNNTGDTVQPKAVKAAR